jgi:hypothetical protein
VVLQKSTIFEKVLRMSTIFWTLGFLWELSHTNTITLSGCHADELTSL